MPSVALAKAGQESTFFAQKALDATETKVKINPATIRRNGNTDGLI
jgi:hypothetical protein